MTTTSGMTVTTTSRRQVLLWASVFLLGGSIAAQIVYPLVEGVARDRATVVVVVAAAAAMLAHAASRLGPTKTLAVFAATAGVGWTAEIVGVATGFPFGAYDYTMDRIGPAVAEVPVIIGLAWTAGGYSMWWISALVTRRRPLRMALATIGMVGWDLYLDPQMVSAGLWTWSTGDAGLPGIGQIPITNFLGWAGVSLVMFGLLSLIDSGPVTVTPMSVVAPVGWFTWTWLGSALAFLVFLDDPGLHAAVPYGLLAMGVLGVPAGWTLYRRTHSEFD